MDGWKWLLIGFGQTMVNCYQAFEESTHTMAALCYTRVQQSWSKVDFKLGSSAAAETATIEIASEEKESWVWHCNWLQVKISIPRLVLFLTNTRPSDVGLGIELHDLTNNIFICFQAPTFSANPLHSFAQFINRIAEVGIVAIFSTFTYRWSFTRAENLRNPDNFESESKSEFLLFPTSIQSLDWKSMGWNSGIIM